MADNAFHIRSPISQAHSSTSVTLLERAKTQDPEAWERLVQLYGPVVFLWCQRFGLTHDAADIAQEVWTAVATHLGEFRRDRPGDTFRGWFCQITRNKILDLRRRRKDQERAAGGSAARQALAEIPGANSDPAGEADPEGIEASARDVVVHRSLELIRAEFEERSWRAFYRTAVDGLSAREVAAELDTTPQAVRKAKSRVLRRLREELDGLLD